jgi:hypothetical protein
MSFMYVILLINLWSHILEPWDLINSPRAERMGFDSLQGVYFS